MKIKLTNPYPVQHHHTYWAITRTCGRDSSKQASTSLNNLLKHSVSFKPGKRIKRKKFNISDKTNNRNFRKKKETKKLLMRI